MKNENVIPVNFKFGFEDVRVIMIGDEPWFVAKDVALVLGYKEPNNAVRSLCKGGAQYTPLKTAGGIQNTRIIRESDVYRLIIKSDLPNAEKFENWVMEDVLPQIRKTGSYTYSGDNASVNQYLSLINKRDDEIKELKEDQKQHKQVNNAHKKHMVTDTPFTVTSVADDFTRLHPKFRNAVVLNKWLISRGIIEKIGKTYQLLQANEDHFVDIGTVNSPQIKITYAGRAWLLDNEQAIRQFASEVSIANYEMKSKNLEFWKSFYELEEDDYY